MKKVCSSLKRPPCRSHCHDATALSLIAPRPADAAAIVLCSPFQTKNRTRTSLSGVRHHSHVGMSMGMSRRSFSTANARLADSAQGPQAHITNKRHDNLLTLAIESSCDDTCVAILERGPFPDSSTAATPGSSSSAAAAARLHFNDKVTADSRDFKGVYPDLAVRSHVLSMAPLLKRALRALPEVSSPAATTAGSKIVWVDGTARRKPDFVTVTRGPGMMSNLTVGLMTAKSLAVSWDVPLLAVNHMEAHALTPRLVHALGKDKDKGEGKSLELGETSKLEPKPVEFPFISVLVSGGHSLLVHSRGLSDHAILAQADNIAIGDLLDKCARLILPESYLAEAKDVMYGRLLEEFAFPPRQPIPSSSSGDPGSGSDYEYEYNYQPTTSRSDEQRIYTSPTPRKWWLTPPMHTSAAMRYDFSGLNGRVKAIVADEHPDLDVDERRELARHTMRLAFEHLASRLVMALKRIREDDQLAAVQSSSSSLASPDETTTTAATAKATDSIKTVVLSGGVASNSYLRHILRSILDVRGFPDVELIYPPVPLCTDNAAMIAWTGLEMYMAGWRSSLDVTPLKKWPLDPADKATGGILGVNGWYREE